MPRFLARSVAGVLSVSVLFFAASGFAEENSDAKKKESSASKAERFWEDAPSLYVVGSGNPLRESLPGDIYVTVGERALPSVVSVLPQADTEGLVDDSLEEFDPNREEMGGGSGFLVSARGMVLTSEHVVADFSEVRVKLSDGRIFAARVLGSDKGLDIALLQLQGLSKGKTLPFLKLGHSSELRIGEHVAALGSPFGLDGSLSVGVVSGMQRDLRYGDFDDFLQTDALINPGSSGGPLVDMRGNVVGVNTAIVASGNKIGFAVPIDLVRAFLPDLSTKGYITRGWAGIQVQNLTHDLVKSLRMERESGVLITGTVPGSPAEKAGFQAEDVLISFAGREITSARVLHRALAQSVPGSEVSAKVWRNNTEVSLKLTLAERVRPDERMPQDKMPKDVLGLQVVPSSPDLRREFSLSSEAGLVVVAVHKGSPADQAGLRVGDLLLYAEREPGQRVTLQTAKDYAQILEVFEKNRSVLFLTRRGPQTRFVVIKDEARE